MRYNLVVAFRGTVTTSDWKQNLLAFKTRESSCSDKDAKVHSGFRKVLASMKVKRTPSSSEGFFKVMKDLRKEMEISGMEGGRPLKNVKISVYLTGHSLGGALAQLSGVRMANEGVFDGKDISLVTYGAPKVGNEEFVECFEKIQFRQKPVRIYLPADVVPKVPPSLMGYKHTPGGLIPKNFMKEMWEKTGIECSHSMLSYYDMLEEDPGLVARVKETLICSPQEKWVDAGGKSLYMRDYMKGGRLYQD